MLAEQHDEWTEMRYIGLDVLARCRIDVIDGTQQTQEVPLAASTA